VSDQHSLPSLEGVWRREGRALDGGDLDEPTWVHWVQVGEHFADVRAEKAGSQSNHWLDRPQGFSGTAAVSGCEVTWTHDLDTVERPAGHSDVGQMEVAGAFLIERGPGYEEYWRQIAPAGAPVAVAERRDEVRVVARVVMVGMFAACVWQVRGRGAALFARDRDWEVAYATGSKSLLREATAATEALAFSRPLPERWQRVVANETLARSVP
jgi:hypothetical protein